MSSVQKFKHLRLIRLHVKGIELTPVEAPPALPEDPSLEELTNAYEDLVDRLTEAGILVAPGTDVENVYGIPEGEPAEAPQTDEQPAE